MIEYGVCLLMRDTCRRSREPEWIFATLVSHISSFLFQRDRILERLLFDSGGRLGGACTAAIFLKRFVDGLIVDGSDNENQEGLIRWAHIDIAGMSPLFYPCRQGGS